VRREPPVLERLRTKARTAISRVWDSSQVVWWRLGVANTIAGDHRYHIVAGQTAVAICGCGEKILQWRDDWYHVHNPEVRGTEDHWAQPATGTIVRHRNWKKTDG
jgi:hypothetical protein